MENIHKKNIAGFDSGFMHARFAHLEGLGKVSSLWLVQLRRLPGIDERNVRPSLARVAPFLAILKLRLGFFLGT